MKSIKTKLVVFIGILLTVVCSGLGLVSYVSSSNALGTNVSESLGQTAKQAAAIVEGRLAGELSVLETIAERESIRDTKISAEDKLSILSSEVKRNGYIKMGIADLNGAYHTNLATADIKDRDYFIKASAGQSNISDPIVSKVDGSLIVNFAVPIKENGKVIGVLVASRDGNELSTIIGDITFGKTGKAFMVNSAGAVIAHSNKELVAKQVNYIEESKKDPTLKELADSLKQMTQGKTAIGEYLYTGIVKYMAYTPIKNTGWSIAVTGPKAEVFERLNALKILLVFISFGILLVSLIIIYIIAEFISKRIKATSTHLNLLAKGDFSTEISSNYLTQKDETGDSCRSMKTMQEAVKGMLLSIKENSMSIDSHSQNLSGVSHQMATAAESVTTAVQETAQGVASQAGDLANITDILNDFGQVLESMVKDIKDIDDNSKHVNDKAGQGNNNMKTLIESVNMVSDTFKNFIDKISGLSQNITQVNEITVLINSIAEQTNLLALNAAIEAARAGEAGKGFGVVADEIRKLAEQTKNSSQNINTLIKNISSETNTIVNTTDTLSNELNNQVGIINKTIESYKQIVEEISGMGSKIKSVSISASGINEEKSRILEKIEGASAVAEEVSASSEEIAASSQEMNASSEEVAASAETLSQMTKEMLGQVNKFTL